MGRHKEDLKPRDLDLLLALHNFRADLWVRVHDLGGKDGSWHAQALAKKLVGRGLASRKQIGGFRRPLWGYTITALGRDKVARMIGSAHGTTPPDAGAAPVRPD